MSTSSLTATPIAEGDEKLPLLWKIEVGDEQCFIDAKGKETLWDAIDRVAQTLQKAARFAGRA